MSLVNNDHRPLYWLELDGLRTVAFAMIFWCHFGPPACKEGDLLGWVANQLINNSFFGVDIFFAMSGFIITSLLLDEKKRNGTLSIKLFWARRIVRIWPLFYLSLFISIAVPALLIGFSGQPALFRYFRVVWVPTAFFLGNFAFIKHAELVYFISATINFPVFTLLFPMWSLCVEEHFYVFWPAVIKQISGTLLIIACVSIIVASDFCKVIFWHFSQSTPHTIHSFYSHYFNSFCRMDGLMVGGLAALTAEKKWFGSATVRVLVAPIFVLTLYWFFFVSANITSNSWECLIAEMVMPWVAITLVLFSMTIQSWKTVLSQRWLVAASKYTYAAYLAHYFVIAYVLGSDPERFCYKTAHGYITELILAIVLTVSISYLCWVLIEQPTQSVRVKLRN